MTHIRNLAARSFFSPVIFSAASTAALGLATFATFAYAMPAHAASVEDETVPTLVVSTKDLDLASPQGRATLQARVKFAVAQVCADAATISDPVHGRIAYDKCRAAAVEKANRRIAVVLGERKLVVR